MNAHPNVSYWINIQDTDGSFAVLHPLQPDHDLVETHRDITDTNRELTDPAPTSKQLSIEADRIRNEWIENATAEHASSEYAIGRDLHDTELVSRLDRAVGIMVGLSCGDALGRPVEFKQPQRIQQEYGEVRDFHADGSHNQPAGTLTDDTV